MLLIVVGVISVIEVRNQTTSTEEFFKEMYGENFAVDGEGNYLFKQSNPLLPAIPIQAISEGDVISDIQAEIIFVGITIDEDTDDVYTHGKSIAKFELMNYGIVDLEYGGSVTDVLLNGQWFNCVGIDYVAGSKYINPGESLKVVKSLVSRDSFKSYPDGHYRIRMIINSGDFIVYEFDLTSLPST